MSVRLRWIVLVLIVALMAWLASGVYFVQPDERAVVRWFGRVPVGQDRVPPGMHWALPAPFCRVERPKTTEVRRIYIGLSPDEREAINRGDRMARLASTPSDMLTGDVNILKVTMVVQYQVVDPVQYLFGTANPDRIVAGAVQGVLAKELSGMAVDQALTGAKAQLQSATLARAQELLDDYGVGVQLVATNLEAIEPPRAIITSFQDVVSAKKDGEKATERAHADASRIMSWARGAAITAQAEAEGYATGRLGRARGEASRFNSLLVEYTRNPSVFRQRLLLQTLETVLPRMDTYILDRQPGDPPTSVRLIEAEEG